MNTTARLTEALTNPHRMADIPRESIAPLMLQLASLQSALAARLLEGGLPEGKASNGDNLLSVKEAAARLGLTEDWLYRRSDKLPFAVHLGRKVRFSKQGIEKYIRQRMGR